MAPRSALQALEAATAGNAGLTLNLAVNYGARTELCDAIRALARDVAAGTLERRRDRRRRARELSLHRGLARSGPADPHRRRAARFQLPALSDRVHGAVVHPGPLAGLRRGLLREALGAFASRQRRFGT